MIITVTMNPAIDKTIEQNVILDAGGKGINVSKTIKALGGDSIAVGFLGSENKTEFLSLLEEFDIKTDFLEVKGKTRVNTKVVETNGNVTENNEVGPYVCEEIIEQLKDRLLQYANKETLFVLSGSVPLGVPKTIYMELIEILHKKEAKVFLDADGKLFSYGLCAKPDIIKPNREELARYCGVSKDMSEDEIIAAGEQFLDSGIGTVIISLGSDGAYFFTKEKRLKLPGISVEAQSTVGAGDAMVAAFCYGMEQKLSFEDCAKLAVATSAGAVETAGTRPPKKERVEELYKRIIS